MQKISKYEKTTAFPRFFTGFCISLALHTQRKRTQNHSMSLLKLASYKDYAKHSFGVRFWKGFGLSGASLGRL